MEAKEKASYNFLDKENQNSEFLTSNDEFLQDARGFLMKRGGYSAERLQDKQEVY